MADFEDRQSDQWPSEIVTWAGSDAGDEYAPRYEPPAEPPVYRPKVLLPVILFVATCASTYLVGGLIFSAALMFTLLAHELGHYLQARRYGVPASLPFFLPMPFSPIGTLGAVIGMRPGTGDRKSLFDIAITGPIAGLVPALVFSATGLWLSQVRLVDAPPRGGLGAPLLFDWLVQAILGPLPDASTVVDLHPLAFAGWVGIFVTALNMIPIGQLDGGHVLYSLLRRRAHGIATLLLALAVGAVILYGYWEWSLMLLLLLLIGPRHPPTADDSVDLGTARTVLGWLSLPFVIIGFTPTPFIIR